jgi:hypothetical protein
VVRELRVGATTRVMALLDRDVAVRDDRGVRDGVARGWFPWLDVVSGCGADRIMHESEERARRRQVRLMGLVTAQ